MHLYHNSHDSAYRKPFGAVTPETELNIALDVTDAPENLCCTLRLWIEGVGEQLIPMEKTGSQFRCHFKAPVTPTLVWYSSSCSLRARPHIMANASLLGGVGDCFDHEPPAWQITVYQETTLPEWYSKGICYQIFPDRFARGADWEGCVRNAAHPDDWAGPPRVLHQSWNDVPFYTRNHKNEVTRWDFFGGTLSGIEEHLLYLHSLGVSAIYLNPIFTASSNHKYDTADYFHVDPGFRRRCSVSILGQSRQKLRYPADP